MSARLRRIVWFLCLGVSAALMQSAHADGPTPTLCIEDTQSDPSLARALNRLSTSELVMAAPDACRSPLVGRFRGLAPVRFIVEYANGDRKMRVIPWLSRPDAAIARLRTQGRLSTFVVLVEALLAEPYEPLETLHTQASESAPLAANNNAPPLAADAQRHNANRSPPAKDNRRARVKTRRGASTRSSTTSAKPARTIIQNPPHAASESAEIANRRDFTDEALDAHIRAADAMTLQDPYADTVEHLTEDSTAVADSDEISLSTERTEITADRTATAMEAEAQSERQTGSSRSLLETPVSIEQSPTQAAPLPTSNAAVTIDTAIPRAANAASPRSVRRDATREVTSRSNSRSALRQLSPELALAARLRSPDTIAAEIGLGLSWGNLSVQAAYQVPARVSLEGRPLDLTAISLSAGYRPQSYRLWAWQLEPIIAAMIERIAVKRIDITNANEHAYWDPGLSAGAGIKRDVSDTMRIAFNVQGYRMLGRTLRVPDTPAERSINRVGFRVALGLAWML